VEEEKKKKKERTRASSLSGKDIGTKAGKKGRFVTRRREAGVP